MSHNTEFLSPAQAATFGKILETYRPKPELLSAFINNSFAVIAGSAGSGKDTLRRKLLALPESPFVEVVSDTTRPPRPREKEGQEYYFKSVDAVMEGYKQGRYLQGALIHQQQVCGIHEREIYKIGRGKIGLSILVVSTEAELHQLKEDIRTVFLVPPSLAALRMRMSHGGVVKAHEEQRRLRSATYELTTAVVTDRYFCIVTEDSNRTAKLADKYFRTGIRDDDYDQQAREVAKSIIEQLTE